MPTTYAHNLFGKKVFQRLDGNLQELILRHREAYIIGLHGPDILFYTRPFHKNHVNQLGTKLHDEPAAPFFEKGKQLYRETKDEEMLVYLLGFVCHFMLDSTCHPYINSYEARVGARHDEIETDLDRELMLATGKDPFCYRPSSIIRIAPMWCKSIASVFDGITEKEIAHTLAAMKFYTDFTVCPTKLKRNFLLGVSRGTGLYHFVQGRVIRETQLKRCKESTERLTVLFKNAIPRTVDMLTGYYGYVMHGGELSPRFNRNYSG